MLLTIVGLVAGCLGAFVISRMMHALLYGVSPMEPIVYVSIGLMLTGVAFLAGWVPRHAPGSTGSRTAGVKSVPECRYLLRSRSLHHSRQFFATLRGSLESPCG
jgi:hypothetical protein